MNKNKNSPPKQISHPSHPPRKLPLLSNTINPNSDPTKDLPLTPFPSPLKYQDKHSSNSHELKQICI
ncbi:hypothetical protein N431DRAFT_438388 [Stipitochalara longipes BDJ]|nr:hypothetical protein N431DRAFT_438388 [Stipitochalara longipes BDJ]